jgi:hypothetical protein
MGSRNGMAGGDDDGRFVAVVVVVIIPAGWTMMWLPLFVLSSSSSSSSILENTAPSRLLFVCAHQNRNEAKMKFEYRSRGYDTTRLEARSSQT